MPEAREPEPEPPPTQFTEVAEVYDSLMSVVPYPWWVRYVQQIWDLHGFAPQRVLELACGTGSVLVELLKSGYEVAGVDSSEAMLRVARRKLPGSVPLWHQDARTLKLPTPPFDACLCLFDSLNYILELDGLRAAVRRVRQHLVEGGSFVFDVNAIRALQMGMFDQTGTGADPSLEYEWHSAWEPATRLCSIQMEFRVHDARTTRVFHETHYQKGYTVEELSSSLRDAGFEVLAYYDAFTFNAPTARSDRYHFVARAV